jgi:long-subunit fatty acid transport protein
VEVDVVKSLLNRVTPLALVLFSFIATKANAQPSQSPWSGEVSVGWDIGLSGDFLAAGIGTLNNVPVVFQSQPFDQVYGNGVSWQFGAGYMLDDLNEVRAQYSYQRVGADAVNLGTAGNNDLVATFDDYHAHSLEAGGRHYFAQRSERMRPYGGASIGVSIISEIDGVLASPQAGLARYATDLYDGTAAFTLGVNGGVLYAISDRFDVNGQIGFRYNSGLSKIDAFAGTGLEDVNDKSSRWTMPIMFGVRVKF